MVGEKCALDWTLMVGEKCLALLVIDTHAKVWDECTATLLVIGTHANCRRVYSQALDHWYSCSV